MAQGWSTGSGKQDEECGAGWYVVSEKCLEQCMQRNGHGVAQVHCQPLQFHMKLLCIIILFQNNKLNPFHV